MKLSYRILSRLMDLGVFQKPGIIDIERLANLTDKEILRCRNIGQKTLTEIHELQQWARQVEFP